MKLTQLITEGNMYTAYVLTDAAREKLAKKFPPKYENFIGHHITEQFGVPKDTNTPDPARIKVIGRVDSGDGLEALVVSVDGSQDRPNGGAYHITWSLDPSKYAPKDSNKLVTNSRFSLSMPIEIETTPQLLN